MKKTVIYILLACLTGTACKKSILQQINPNQPTAEGLSSEQGITSFALGIFEKWVAGVPNEGTTNIMVTAWIQHSIMGDEIFCPYGNFGWRYADQVYSIKLPDGTVIKTPIGVDQKTTMQSLNSRGALDRNGFVYEWEPNYFMIVQANLLQQAIANPALKLSGDAATKKNTLKAWAYWWKGYAYSRLGSLYLGAVINNGTDGSTNGGFKDHAVVIAEANKNFDSCASILASLANNDGYKSIMKVIIPSIFSSAKPVLDLKNGDITPAMWLRQVYTYEARNFLVNKKVRDMTAADWTQLSSLTDKGIQKDDNVFVYALDPNLVNDLTGSQGLGSLYASLGSAAGYTFISERLIQDFKPTDNRFTQGFEMIDTTKAPFNINILNRGLQFGSRYNPVNIEDGGFYASNTNRGISNIAGTWDENALMKAEALIRSGSDIEGGLQGIDAVRNAQNAGLPAVAGTGLSQVQAIEELRQERRVGLFLRGLAFYDARRWGVTEPVSSGGGRNNAMVLIDGGTLGGGPTAPPQLVSCQMDYRYMDYWDIPQNELDFNAPASGAAPVKN